MRHTARGIILKDHHILLVTGHGADFYWTPGGGVEDGESIIDTLRREIQEELGVKVSSHAPYYLYAYEDQKVDTFLITINGDIQVGEEITGYVWYSSRSEITPSNGFAKILLPKLIADDLLV